MNTTEKQINLSGTPNYYPDLTFINKENENVKFAVDLKTINRKKNGVASFTLGSHGRYRQASESKK